MLIESWFIALCNSEVDFLRLKEEFTKKDFASAVFWVRNYKLLLKP